MLKKWNSLTLSFKLIVLQSIILIITTAGLSWSLLRHFENSLAERTLSQLESVRALKKHRIQIALDRVIRTAQVAVEEVKIHGEYPNGLGQILKRMPFQYKWNSIEWLGPANDLPTHSSCIIQPKPEEKTAYFCSVTNPAGKDPLSSKDDPIELWVIVQHPYRVGLKVAISEVDEILKLRDGMGETGSSFLIDLNLPNGNSTRRPLIQSPITDQGQGSYLNEEGEETFYTYAPISRTDLRWVQFSELGASEALGPARESKRAFIPAILGALAMAIAAAYGLSLKIIQNAQNSEERSWVSGQDTERARLARELHDGVGQLLTWFSLKISSSKLNPIDKTDLQSGLSRIQNELRRVVQNLAPLSLKDLGWIRSAEALCDEFERTTGKIVKLDIESALNETRIQPFGKLQVFRILQECLNNVAKHSDANRVEISVGIQKNSLKIRVDDDGKGFGEKMFFHSTPEAQLRSLHQRVSLLRGGMQVSNLPEGGARLDFELPLEKL